MRPEMIAGAGGVPIDEKTPSSSAPLSEPSGTGLLCLHGFTGSGASWRRFRELAPRGWQIETPDLTGHGAALDSTSHTFAEESQRLLGASELVARRTAVGTDERHGSLVLLGYSLGARVALQILSSRPAAFDAAVLVGVHPGLSSEPERRARERSDQGWIEMLETRGLGSFLNAWCAQPLFGSQQTAGAEARADQDAVRRAQNPSGLARSLREFGLARMPEASQALESTQIPTTLVVGSSDQKFLALAEQLVGRSQNQRLCLEVVEGAGHNVLLERPEALVDVVRRARDAAAAQLAPARELSAGRAGSA